MTTLIDKLREHVALNREGVFFGVNAAEGAELLSEIDKLTAERDEVRADEEHSNRDIERLNGEVLRAWGEVRHRDKQLDRLREQRANVIAICDSVDRLIVASGQKLTGNGLTAQVRAAFADEAQT